MKPSERIKQLKEKIQEENPEYPLHICYLAAVTDYLDEQWEIKEAPRTSTGRIVSSGE